MRRVVCGMTSPQFPRASERASCGGLYPTIFAAALPLQAREFADGQRPRREARPVRFDLAWMQAARRGEHFSDRGAAHAALARSHAAACERLQLVQSLT